jgi:hypothetical protein
LANTANASAESSFSKANTANVTAEASFSKANSANVLAQASFDLANTTNVTADAAYAKSNSANIIADAAFTKANAANVLAQNAYDYANTISVSLNNQFITNTANTANAGFNHANGAFDKANTALLTASLSWITSNTSQITGEAAFTKANSAFDFATNNAININTTNIKMQSAFDSANIAKTDASAAFNKANAANVLAQGAYDTANTVNTTLYLTIVDEVAAFNKANSANIIAQASFDLANTAFNFTQASFAKANTANVIAQGAYDTANTALATAALALNYDNFANAAFDKANSANVLAQSAFNTANNANTRTIINGLGNSKLDFNTYGANSAYLTTTGDDTTALFMGAVSADLYAYTSIQIRANTGGTSKQWTFGDDGTLTFPDSTIQNTAFTGSAIDQFARDTANTSNISVSFSATTILEVSANGSTSYRFSQYGVLDNPNVTTFSATTLGFNLNSLAGSHPFHIRLGDNSADFSNGLVHVSTTGTLSYDSAAQGKTSGTLFWRIPHTSVGNYKYRCSAHPGAMIGEINIANTASIYLAYNT